MRKKKGIKGERSKKKMEGNKLMEIVTTFFSTKNGIPITSMSELMNVDVWTFLQCVCFFFSKKKGIPIPLWVNCWTWVIRQVLS